MTTTTKICWRIKWCDFIPCTFLNYDREVLLRMFYVDDTFASYKPVVGYKERERESVFDISTPSTAVAVISFATLFVVPFFLFAETGSGETLTKYSTLQKCYVYFLRQLFASEKPLLCYTWFGCSFLLLSSMEWNDGLLGSIPYNFECVKLDDFFFRICQTSSGTYTF